MVASLWFLHLKLFSYLTWLLLWRFVFHFHYYYYHIRDLIGILTLPTTRFLLLKDTHRSRVKLDRNVALCSRPTINVISPLLPERMSMLKCLTPLRHSHMNQVWSEEEKEDINREIVKTKVSWLLERYSSSTFLPFSLLLSRILFSTDLLWISPTPVEKQNLITENFDSW